MLVRWVPPTSEVQRSPLFDEALSFFRQPFIADRAMPNTWAAPLTPPADVVETANDFTVSLDLPGHDPTSLDVKLEGDTLTIQAERRQARENEGFSYVRNERGFGRFARSFVLPTPVDGNKCQASYRNGVLTVTIPKREEARARSIDVKVQS